MGRGTVAAGDGGGAATSRHSPSVSPPGCHLPMASPQGGIQAATGPPRSTQSRFRFLQRSEEHTSELQSLMRISYAVFCLKKKKIICINNTFFIYISKILSSIPSYQYNNSRVFFIIILIYHLLLVTNI